MPKRILTQEDLDNNPEFAEQDCKPGDEVEIPEPDTNENIIDPAADDDTGGSAPPPNKERP